MNKENIMQKDIKHNLDGKIDNNHKHKDMQANLQKHE